METSENDSDSYLMRKKLKDVSSARSVFEKLWRDDELRRKQRSQTRSQLEGGRPFDQNELIRRGEAWRCNHNFRDAESSRDRALLPYWEMAHNAPSKITARIDSDSPHVEKWNNIFQVNFDKFIEDWGMDWILQYRLMVEEFISYGIGFPFWKDEKSPRWESFNNDRVLFPKRTSICHKKWTTVCILDYMTPSELYKYAKEESSEASEYAGWNSKVAKSLLLQIGRRSINSSFHYDDWGRIQDEITNNDISVDECWDQIEVVWLFSKSDDGCITKYLFSRNSISPDYEDICNCDDFLYCSDCEEDGFQSILGAIFWHVGNGQIHGVKGFSVKNFGHSLLMNRMKSKIVDGTTFALSMNFSRQGDPLEDGPTVENYGSVNILPPGLEQLKVNPNLNEGINVLSMLDNNMSSNNYQYREQSRQIAEVNTARQAELLAGQEQQVTEANSALYLSQLGEVIYKEMFRRLRKGKSDDDAILFKKRCLEMGMPEDVFSNKGNKFNVSVYSGNSPGTSNSVARTMLWQDLMSLRGMPGVNWRWILENYLSSRLGANAMKQALFPVGQDQDAYAVRRANEENFFIAAGHPESVIEADDHATHIQVHLQTLIQVMQGLAQGSGKQEQLIFLNIVIPHIDEHFMYLENDKSNEQLRKQLIGQYNNVRNSAQKIIADIAEQNQQNQPQI